MSTLVSSSARSDQSLMRPHLDDGREYRHHASLSQRKPRDMYAIVYAHLRVIRNAF